MPGLTASLFISALGFSCMLSNCDGLANYFVRNTVYSNVIDGTMQLTFNEYRPTCGWKMILTCSIEIASVISDTTTLFNIDNFTYILGNKSYNYDYTIYGEATFSTDVYTVTDPSFGVVNATWYCVCNDSTAGLCLMVNSLGIHSTTVMTTVEAPTPPVVSPKETQTTPMVNPVGTQTTPVVNPVGTLTTLPPPGSGSIHLNEKEGQCYTGSTLEPLGKVRSLVECGSVCIGLLACSGVNFRPSTDSCDLVLEDTVSNPSLLGTVTGCTFWEVVWKL